VWIGAAVVWCGGAAGTGYGADAGDLAARYKLLY